MHIPKKEKRTAQDFVEYMKTCAKQYVPEWQYNEEDPDAGTALVALFADMMSDNIRRFNLSAAKDMLSFFHEVHANMLPAKPAEGFVTFELPEGLEREEEVLQGTKLLAQAEDIPVVFETREDVLVRQMDLEKIYVSNPQDDGIYQVFDREREKTPSFYLFGKKGKNLQRHRIFFCFPHGLDIAASAAAELSFQFAGAKAEVKKWRQALREGNGISFSYGTVDGYEAVTDLRLSQKGKEPEVIHSGEEPEAEYLGEDRESTVCFEITGGDSGIAAKEEFDSMYVIQAEIRDAELFSKVRFSSLSLSVRNDNCKPDLLHVNGTDQEMEDFPVFGTELSLYNECYIVSEEALGKAGAHVRLEFDLDFVKLPLELPEEEKRQWKTIMKKRDFVPEKEYDITVQEVVWEYYNGFGWTRLPEGNEYKHLFQAGEDFRSRRVKMEFACPADISRVLVNSTESYAIRARILKINNAYKTRGAYVAPVAGRVLLSYDYSAAPLFPSKTVRQNNLKRQEISREEMEKEGFSAAFCDRNPDQNDACYLGFGQPFSGGPLKLLFVLNDMLRQDARTVQWEYCGKDGWKPLHPIDGTKGFHHTGLVSWTQNHDLCRTALFGQELYWIRLLDLEDGCLKPGSKKEAYPPKVEGIYPNSTSILGIETVEERYGIAPLEEEKKIRLPFTDIADIRVQVLERKDFRQGALQPVWEEWKEAKELDGQSGKRREFAVDRQSGWVTFPKYMNISCLDEQDEIAVRIRYQHCQGERGNQKAGEINRLSQSIGFISGSFNPIAAAGGVSGETVAEAVKRNAQVLRHGYRCVSAGDYEDMAWEATRNISKVKCFSGYDREGNRKPGAVTLVVLPKEYAEHAYSFERIKLQIQEYISAHMDETIFRTGKFSVIRPELISLDVKALIEPEQENEIFSVRKKAQKELERFLHPLDGNFYGEGWEIGTLPDRNQIAHALKRTGGVKFVQNLTFQTRYTGSGAEPEEEKLPFYRLPWSGTHEIQLSEAFL